MDDADETMASLDAFFIDEDVKWLLANARENRALKIAFPKEIHVSNMLAWLLSPDEGHGLGDLPIKELLFEAASSCAGPPGGSVGKFRPSFVANRSFANMVVVREYAVTDPTGRIDLVLVDPMQELVIAVENKYGARQSADQLKNYAEAIASQMERGTTWELICVLLDSDPDSAPEDPRWIKVSYEWITRMLRTQLDLKRLSADSEATLREFVEYLGDVGLAPYLRLDGDHVVDRARKVADKHQGIIRKMRDLRRQLSEPVAVLMSPKPEPIAIEYIRHRLLWDHVLETSDRAELITPVQRQLPGVLEDLDSGRCWTYFALPNWTACRIPADEGKDATWPIYAFIYRSSEKSSSQRFRVGAEFWPELIQPSQREALVTRAKGLRTTYKMSAKGMGGVAKRFKLASFECETQGDAIDKLVYLMKDIDQTLFAVKH